MSHDEVPSTCKTPDPVTDNVARNDTEPAPAPEPMNEPNSDPSPVVDDLEEASKVSMQFIVRGGTTTSAWDKEQARREADAEVRRKQLDADRRLASIPLEQGGAMMFDHNFADPLTTPKVHIRYVNSKKETIMDQLCEMVTDDISGDTILQFVCPKCVMRGIHPGDAQCTVRDSNRKWHLDTRTSGMAKIQTVDMRGRPVLEPYLNAGMIMDTDVLVCPAFNCGAKYKIHKNMLYDWRSGR